MNDAFIETISQLQMSPHPIGKWSLSSSHSILSLQSLPVPGSPHCLWSGRERERSKGNMLSLPTREGNKGVLLLMPTYCSLQFKVLLLFQFVLAT